MDKLYFARPGITQTEPRTKYSVAKEIAYFVRGSACVIPGSEEY